MNQCNEKHQHHRKLRNHNRQSPNQDGVFRGLLTVFLKDKWTFSAWHLQTFYAIASGNALCCLSGQPKYIPVDCCSFYPQDYEGVCIFRLFYV